MGGRDRIMESAGLVLLWARVGRDRQKKEAAGWVGLDWCFFGQEWGGIDRRRKLLDR